MKINPSVRKQILELLLTTVLKKIDTYQPETVHAPFHHRLLGKDRYALFSFIHSMSTTFGTSVFEQVAEALASGVGYRAERQFKLLGQIDEKTAKLIDKINLSLRSGKMSADKSTLIEQIRKSIVPGNKNRDPDSTVDLYVEVDGCENYIDITSAKPNMKEFATLQRKLMRWIALRLSINKSQNVMTKLAIPYNPYHPKPYERWTLQGLFDLKRGEVLVGEEFWNFVGGGDIYQDLLDIFEEAGKQLRPELDKKFAQYKNSS